MAAMAAARAGLSTGPVSRTAFVPAAFSLDTTSALDGGPARRDGRPVAAPHRQRAAARSGS